MQNCYCYRATVRTADGRILWVYYCGQAIWHIEDVTDNFAWLEPPIDEPGNLRGISR